MPIKIIDLDAGRGNILIGSGSLTGKEYVEERKTFLKKLKVSAHVSDLFYLSYRFIEEVSNFS